MKWQGSLLLVTVLASGALAQEPQPLAVTPTAPTFAAGDTPACAPDMCCGPAGRTSD
jgi:hypothetical protein